MVEQTISKLKKVFYPIIMSATIIASSSWGLSSYFTHNLSTLQHDIRAIQTSLINIDNKVEVIATNLHKLEVDVSSNKVRIAYLEKQCDRLEKN